MSKMNKLCNQLRLQYVKRWHVVHQTHDQSVAEHSINTAFIARELAARLGLSHRIQDLVTVAALFHDIDEVITGDIPGPFKRTIPEEVFGRSRLPEVRILGAPPLARIVKLADMMETAWHAAVHGVTPHARQVAADCSADLFKALDDCPWQELADTAHTVWGDVLNAEYDFV